MGPMFPAPWLPAHFIASEPVGEGVLRPYALTEQAQRLDAPFLPGVRWVVVRGLLAENWLQRNHPSAVRVQAADFDEAVKLLVSRQADVYLGFELVARRDIHLLRLEGDLIEGGAVARFPQAFMVHQRNPQLLQALNAGIRQIRNSGELDAIRKQWEPAPVVTVNEHRLQRAAAWGYAISLVVALSALIAVGLLWQRAQRLARERGKLLGDMQWAQAVEAQTFDANPTPMSISRASDLSLVRVNDAYVRTFGFSRGELLGMRGPARQWANPGEREALIAQALRDGSSGPRVVQVSHAQGRTIWMRVAYQRLQVAGADYVLATVADVTEIETQRREYEVMLAKAPVGILVYEGDRIVLANDEIERLLGWTPGTAIGRRAADVWRDDAEREWAKNFYRDRLRTDDLVPYEHEIGGAERRFHARGVAVRISDHDDKKIRSLWTCTDAGAEAKVNAERDAARRAAEEANAAKSRFLANISHEIRTPLHALINLHEMLSLTPLSAPQGELMQKARHASHTLMAVVGDVLDFSKIEAGAMVLETTPFALDALVQSLEAVLQSHARSPGVALRVERACHGPVTLVGDVTRLRQVLINMGSNALKFTRQGEVLVRIGCEPLPSTNPGDAPRVRLNVSVRDSGIGMDAVTQAALFTPFLQADSSITRRYGGTGLGLAISQSIVRAMGSEIAVQSSPGAGSEFSFSVELPMVPAVAANRVMSLPAADLPQGQALAGLRVLVVDDNELNRFVLKRMLGDDGAGVGEAGDGRAALQWLAAAPQPPDLVLMDLQMPVMDGVTAVRAMQADARWRGVPVIIVSGDVTTEQRDAALANGARAFLPKPMMRDQLLAQVALLGITPRTPQADDSVGADARASVPSDAPAALVPNVDQLDELLLSVAVNELRWGRTTIGMLMAAAPVDAARLAQTAHRIKGTARELRCEPLVVAALVLEQACKRDPKAQRGPWPVAELLQQMDAVHALLSPRLDGQASMAL